MLKRTIPKVKKDHLKLNLPLSGQKQLIKMKRASGEFQLISRNKFIQKSLAPREKPNLTQTLTPATDLKHSNFC